MARGARLIAYPDGAVPFVPAGQPDDRRSTTTILLERTLLRLNDDDADAGRMEWKMGMLLVAFISFVLGGIIVPLAVLWLDGYIDVGWELRRVRQEIVRRCEFVGRPRRRAVVTSYRLLRHRHEVDQITVE